MMLKPRLPGICLATPDDCTPLYLRNNATANNHTGKCIRGFGGIYAYCRYFIDRKWLILVLILYRKKNMPYA